MARLPAPPPIKAVGAPSLIVVAPDHCTPVHHRFVTTDRVASAPRNDRGIAIGSIHITAANGTKIGGCNVFLPTCNGGRKTQRPVLVTASNRRLGRTRHVDLSTGNSAKASVGDDIGVPASDRRIVCVRDEVAGTAANAGEATVISILK